MIRTDEISFNRPILCPKLSSPKKLAAGDVTARKTLPEFAENDAQYCI